HRAAELAVAGEEFRVVVDVLGHHWCSPSVVPADGSDRSMKKPRPSPAGPQLCALPEGQRARATGVPPCSVPVSLETIRTSIANMAGLSHGRAGHVKRIEYLARLGLNFRCGWSCDGPLLSGKLDNRVSVRSTLELRPWTSSP